MTDWLLDTNILSELRRKKPSQKVLAFIGAQQLERLFVSSISIAEIRFGIERQKDLSIRAELNDWLAQKVRPMFDQRILPVTEDIIFKWRILVEEGRRRGHTFSQPDLFITATALVHNMTVVTRNTNDFTQAHVPVMNPWNDHS